MNNFISPIKTSLKNINPLYGAVLMLLVGQAILGAPERKAAHSFNKCVSSEIWENAKRTSDPGKGQRYAVQFCNGGR